MTASRDPLAARIQGQAVSPQRKIFTSSNEVSEEISCDCLLGNT